MVGGVGLKERKWGEEMKGGSREDQDKRGGKAVEVRGKDGGGR